MIRSRQGLVAAGALVMLAASGCDSIPTEASMPQLSAEGRAQRITAELAPESPYGVGFSGNHLTSYETNLRAAQLMRAAGVRHARVTAYWYELQQGTDNTFTPWAMAPFRDKIQALLDVGITPYVTLLGTACFARNLPFPCSTQEAYSAPKSEHWSAWQTYVGQMVDSFPEVTHWSIWNEPNAEFLYPERDWYRPNRLHSYGELVASAAPVIRARGRKVVAAELGDGSDIGTGMSKQEWLRNFMASYGQHVDVAAVHLYSQGTTTGFVNAMKEYAQALSQAGYPNKTLWLTEVGDGNINPSDAVQNSNLTAVYQAMSYRSVPGWSKTFYHDAGTFTDPKDNWGLVRDLGLPWQSPRPAYYALQAAATPRVSISGPLTVGAYQSGNWEARVTGGTPPYAYHFTVDGSAETGSGRYFQYTNDGVDFGVHVTVTDASGSIARSSLAVRISEGTCIICE